VLFCFLKKLLIKETFISTLLSTMPLPSPQVFRDSQRLPAKTKLLKWSLAQPFAKKNEIRSSLNTKHSNTLVANNESHTNKRTKYRWT
jgi:hypothetical protein